MVIYSKYGHFCLQEVRFVSFVVFHDDMRDLHSGNTDILLPTQQESFEVRF